MRYSVKYTRCIARVFSPTHWVACTPMHSTLIAKYAHRKIYFRKCYSLPVCEQFVVHLFIFCTDIWSYVHGTLVILELEVSIKLWESIVAIHSRFKVQWIILMIIRVASALCEGLYVWKKLCTCRGMHQEWTGDYSNLWRNELWHTIVNRSVEWLDGV